MNGASATKRGRIASGRVGEAERVSAKDKKNPGRGSHKRKRSQG